MAGVGNPPRVGSGTLDVVQAHRYIEKEFEAQGTKVEWVFSKGAGPATNEALTTGQVDFGTQGALPALLGRAGGLDTRALIVSEARTNSYVGVRPDSPIRSVADLRGRRIAVHKGTAGHLSGLRILREYGIGEKDVRLLNLDTGSAVAAFLSGDLDAIFGGVNLLRLRNKKLLRIIFDTRKTPVATAPGIVLVRSAFAAQYPQTTRRVVKAYVKAARWASDDANREAVFRLWAEFGSTTVEDYREEYEGVPLRDQLSPVADPFVLARLRDSAEDSYRLRLVRRKVDTDSWPDRELLASVLQELKLADYWPTFDAAGKLLTPGREA
ncbi:ABC transporter substrate-binding protein [Xylophilus sp.]|uniref:ABC transporter substrate-binding protein n=1 Tax=Xylophilus sp. TaxID=2653893 RepID=UPI002D7FACF7|nr:ABC transporter substrate-binding protein [Xylophilus sp.]